MLSRYYFAAVLVLVHFVAYSRTSFGEVYVTKWKNNAKAAWSLSTDDNRTTQVYTIAPALTERGLRGTFYVNASPTRSNWVNLMDVGDINGDGLADGFIHLPEQGHELGSHTSEHWAVTVGNPHPDVPNEVFASYEDLAADCVAINEYLESLTGQRVVSFAYPWGRNDAPSREVISQYYLSARTTAGSASSNGHFIPNNDSPNDMMGLKSFYVEGPYYTTYSLAISRFTQILDDTVNVGGWGIEYFHQTGSGSPSPFGNWGSVDRRAYYEHLDNIVDAVENGDIWQDTVGNVTRYIYSRDAATIEYDEYSDSVIKWRIDDSLDDELFSVPLTIVAEIPESWMNGANFTYAGGPFEYELFTDPLSGSQYIKFEMVPDGRQFAMNRIVVGPFQADFNSDGMITEDDFYRWRDDYGMTVEIPGTGSDGNSDGVVNAADYGVWRDLFNCYECGVGGHGWGGSGAAATPIPEPATVFYLLPMIVISILRRQRPWNCHSER